MGVISHGATAQDYLPISASQHYLYCPRQCALIHVDGLDAAVGFLHTDRPGRPSLALDLIEELRSFLCDRLALSLINRRQVDAAGFEVLPGGPVRMSDTTRKTVIVA